MPPADVTAMLLAESAWIQRLARSLVRDAGVADDLAQETLIEAIERPPADVEQPRGWLATVLRRRLSRRRRTESRLLAREQAASSPEASDAVWAAHERLRRHEDLVRIVQALPEPYKSVILLRFFEDMAPREIAEHLSVPVATVNSRIQRGLAQLREQLDGQAGGREEWLAAYTAIAWPRAGGVVASSSWMGVLMVMQWKWWLSAGAVLLLGWWWLSSEPSTSLPLSQMESAPALVQAEAVRSTALENNRGETQRVQTAAAVVDNQSASPTASFRVVDIWGRALEGVPVMHHGAVWPRWQNGDLGWINDGVQGLFLPPAEVERLRADEAAAEKFFAQFRHPADWRAVVFGTPLGERTSISDAQGRFTFPQLPADQQLDVGVGWMLLAQAQQADGSLQLIVAPSIRVAGRVLNPQGDALGNGKVTASLNASLALSRAFAGQNLSRVWSPGSINADDEGRYLLRAIPLGVLGLEIHASAPGWETCKRVPPDSPREDFDLVLAGASRTALNLRGRVLGLNDEPLFDAEVILGRDRTRTDAQGAFEFPQVEPAEDARLTAILAGYSPVQEFGVVPKLQAQAPEQREVTLRMRERTRSLRGVVLDARGAALEGVLVNVYDPALLDITFTPLEGRLGGWERGQVTASDGSFELGGLAGRAYRLRVWKPETSIYFVSEPYSASETQVVVQLHDSAFHRQVRGRIQSADGALPKGLHVALVYPIHLTKGGGGSMGEGTALVPVDAEGRFELQQVPRRYAELVIGSTPENTLWIPVESIAEDGQLQIEWKTRRTLRVVGRAEGASLSVVDANDLPLPIEDLRSKAKGTVAVLWADNGDFAPCSIAAEAKAVIVQRPDASWIRIPIEDDSFGLARAMLP